jgi:hypothetical protein
MSAKKSIIFYVLLKRKTADEDLSAVSFFLKPILMSGKRYTSAVAGTGFLP